MRIIIESAEKAIVTTPVSEPTPLTQVETMDGGSPSETLIQAIAEALPTSTEREGMDGGSPPEWLVEAIQGATYPHSVGSGMDTDAGSAPSSGDRSE
jgi:hypothetical protein